MPEHDNVTPSAEDEPQVPPASGASDSDDRAGDGAFDQTYAREPFADDGFDDEDDEPREGLTRGIRKALASGIRTVLNADEALQRGMPREVAGYIMRQTDAAKDEIVRAAGVQIRKFLENVDVGGEIQKILTSVSFEIRTEVRFIPNDKSVSPRAKMKVRVRDNATGDEVTADARDGLDAAEEVVAQGLRGAWKRRMGSAVDRAMNAFQRELGIDELEEGETEPDPEE